MPRKARPLTLRSAMLVFFAHWRITCARQWGPADRAVQRVPIMAVSGKCRREAELHATVLGHAQANASRLGLLKV